MENETISEDAFNYKFGLNITRTAGELQYYFDKCNNKHFWILLRQDATKQTIELQCSHCGVLSTATAELIKR